MRLEGISRSPTARRSRISLRHSGLQIHSSIPGPCPALGPHTGCVLGKGCSRQLPNHSGNKVTRPSRLTCASSSFIWSSVSSLLHCHMAFIARSLTVSVYGLSSYKTNIRMNECLQVYYCLDKSK